MGLYSGGLNFGRIFASEIWGAYCWEGLCLFVRFIFIYKKFIYLFIFCGGGGGGGLLAEFYGISSR